MENQRLFIFIALVFLGMMMYSEWERDHAPKTTGPQTSTTERRTSSPTVPSPVAENDSTVPSAVPAAKPEGATISGTENKLKRDKRIHVRTDFLDVELDTVGGDIRQVKLVKFPVDADTPDQSFEIMTDTGSRLFVAQSGFSMVKGNGPTHKAKYTTEKMDYKLTEGKNELKVDLFWTNQSGVKVTRTYTFKRSSYIIDMAITVENNSKEAWQGSFYKQMQRTHFAEDNKSMFVMQTYMGGVIYTPEELYEKISFSDMQEKNLGRVNIKGGWIAMMQHYFLGAWIPNADEVNNIYSKYVNYRYYLGMISAVENIDSGKNKTFTGRYYVGPKDQNSLSTISPGLELTVDYGFLTVLAKPLFWLLNTLHSVFGNWGWAIIFLTVIIKLAFFKLSEKSYRSMANMRKLQPRMKALKERHGDDRQKMNQALMELYKKEKINPLGGCLPILVQIPVFIALYWVLMEAVELRQAPFMLWITDLSAQDPYYVLPILMGISMFLQQKLNPAPLDPMQAKVMMFLPLVFTIFFLFFPAGLVLYWVVNNTLSIAQQYVITKRIEAGGE